MAKQVVPEQEIRIPGEVIQVGECSPSRESSLPKEARLVPNRPDLVDGPVWTRLQVQQEAAVQKRFQTVVHGRIIPERAGHQEGAKRREKKEPVKAYPFSAIPAEKTSRLVCHLTEIALVLFVLRLSNSG